MIEPITRDPSIESRDPVKIQETLRHRLAERARRHPDRPALGFEGRWWTHGELDRLAEELATTLRALGVGPEILVGIHLERGPAMLVALLAVHRAAGAYLPLDPKFPARRLEFMAEDSGVGIVLADGPVPWRLPAGTRVLTLDSATGELTDGTEPGAPELATAPSTVSSTVSRSAEAEADHLAYVLYTSGSTGRPKGVQVTHGALLNFLDSMAERPGFGEDDVLVAVTTLSFDIAGLELFLPLLCGGRLVIAPREVAIDGPRLARLLESSRATVLQATPATWKLLLDTGWRPTGLRMLCGGEALPRELASRLTSPPTGSSERSDEPELWNLYGPTETTIWSAVARISHDDDPILVGGPIARTELLITDRRLVPVADGEEGEIVIGGAGLARGYFGRPALTAERFVPHPTGRPGERVYRTGDLGRVHPRGGLQCLGRLDQQVKIRGFRIELGEIETVLAEHEAVEDVAVVAASRAGGDLRLVAYLVTAAGRELPRRELDSLLTDRLPDYMRPTALVELEALPLTPNRKVDRKALAERPLTMPEERPVEAPRGAMEERVVRVWQQVLEVPAVDREDDFFALGGHSLLGGRVMARLGRELGTELPPSLLFEHPTPAEFALAIERRLREGIAVPVLEKRPREGVLPASFAQERLWLHDQMEPGSNAFNMAYAIRLEGELSLPVLEASLRSIAARHEMLRTRVLAGGTVRGGAVQVIDPVPRDLLAEIDLSQLDHEPREREAGRLAAALAARSFDLARGPLMVAAVLRLSSDAAAPDATESCTAVFCLTLHHILGDGWSMGLLIEELMAYYTALREGEHPRLARLPVQYADFALWQRESLSGETLENALSYWQRQLAGPSPAVLPTDRPPSRAGGRARHVEAMLGAGRRAALERLAEREGTTLFMVALAALDCLLYRITGETRTTVGSMHANRNHPAIERLIGIFVNLLAFATDIDPAASFRQLLGAVRRTALGAYAHQDTPFERVVERVRPARPVGRNPLFQVMVLYQNVPMPALDLPGLEVSPFEPAGAGKQAAFDWTFLFLHEGDDLRLVVEYDEGLYDRATARRLLAYFVAILETVAEDPELPIAELPADPEAVGGRLEADGRLWLTDPAEVSAAESAPSEPDPEATAKKASAIQSRLAGRRSKLSKKQLALLRKRLGK